MAQWKITLYRETRLINDCTNNDGGGDGDGGSSGNGSGDKVSDSNGDGDEPGWG